jgi:DNA topoisomerase-1
MPDSLIGDQVRDVGSSDVNEYLHQISGHDFTAKDFRTWAGTALAAFALREFDDFDSQAAAKRNITKAIEHVAERLGNTKTVCRKCYIHPAVIDAYLDHSLRETLNARTERDLRESLTNMPAAEAAVLAVLQQRMNRKLHITKNKSQSPRQRVGSHSV